MPVNQDAYTQIRETVDKCGATLVAVSKTKPVADILELYALGQRDFGENYVQELVEKQSQLPKDIRWHFIGHLQSNKAKYITPFVHLVHGVDSLKLLKEISRQAGKIPRTIDVLLQLHIAREETKFGLDQQELLEILRPETLQMLQHVRIRGLMGMASFTDNQNQIAAEFENLKAVFDRCRQQLSQDHFSILSMGMSADYALALDKGSTMVRIGSLLFGARP